MSVLVAPLSHILAFILLLFAARRWLFTLIALFPAARVNLSPPPQLPHLLLLVPGRNEEDTLPGLLTALEQQDYPQDRVTVVLIDDGSTDHTRVVMETWARAEKKRHVLRLVENVGKANALNAALAAFPAGEIVVVYDADERPRPNALTRLVAHFADERVGAVSGQRAISNPLASPVATYAAFEALVHQHITLQAKDRLGLAPAVLGAHCAYRRSALAQVGGFAAGALLEDTDITLRLAQAGWLIRFVPEAVSFHAVPESVRGYWRQHTRWARGFNEVAWNRAGALLRDPRLPLHLRLELLAFALGYLDRVALLLAGIGVTLRRDHGCLLRALAVSLITPLLQVLVALKVRRAPAALWSRVILLPGFFALDIAMAVVGLLNAVRGSPPVWEERRSRRCVWTS